VSVILKKLGGSLAAVIPADVVKEAGFKKGQAVDVTYHGGKVVIAPAQKPDWASFFAMDFGIPKGFRFERTVLEDRDVFGLKDEPVK
jgi:antitoxin component of MazEF toxin-antitoxin module